AVDLGNGGRFGDFPDVVLESLLTDIVGMWRRRDLGTGLMLAVDGREPVAVQPDSPPTDKVSGPLAAVVRWAAGRGNVGVGIEGYLKEPPRWL
ncbi:maleylpyruvate isomerase, partial [Rhodococcus sp. NPDC127530]